MNNNIGIIGVGNITQILLKRLVDNKFKGKIFIHDIDKNKKKYSIGNKIIFKKDLEGLLSDTDLVLIAVKPKDYIKICANIKNFINSRTVVMTLMAGVTSKNISKHLKNPKLPIIRVMTNINGKFGYAVTFLHHNKHVTNNKLAKVKAFWKNFGSVNTAQSEIEMDKVTALLGSGPAYFLEFTQSLIRILQNFGYSKEKSNKYISELFFGTAYLCNNDIRTIDKIKQTVASKGGTTESALKSLKKNKFQKILEKSITDAFKRAKSISKEN